jgi:membrane-bound metal-dependent hydrolase YbcI (DUF457 family)
MTGAIVASPYASDSPEVATALVVGSVLPDIDFVARFFGKPTYLNQHQSSTHAIPILALLALIPVALWSTGRMDLYAVTTAALAGMVLHVVMDLSNTYGVKLLWPFWDRRFCFEWVSYLDAIVSTATLLALGLQWWWNMSIGHVSAHVWWGWWGMCGVYWVIKAWWRWRAGRWAPPNTESLVPSSVVPWLYYGYMRRGDRVRLFEMDGIRGTMRDSRTVQILDDEWGEVVEDLPEFQSMRTLSGGYHIVSAEPLEAGRGTRLECRDLQWRNVDARFGRLVVHWQNGEASVEAFQIQ